MKQAIIKQWGTKDSKALKEPRYPQNKIYRTTYSTELNKQAGAVRERITELDNIIATKTGNKKSRAEVEKILKEGEIAKLEETKKQL